MAMVRTVFSPRCCATSTTRFQGFSLMAGLVIRSALKMGGRAPSENSTSTTGPITCVMRPTLGMLRLSFQRLCARDDLHQLLGDGRLAYAVHHQREPADHVGGVSGGVVHGGHAGAVLAGGRLEKGLPHHRLDVAGKQPVEQSRAIWLEDVVDGGYIAGRE